jgi:hypothetical protein
MLAGLVQRAAVYDRALTAEEVAASAAADSITAQQLANDLSPELRDKHRSLRAQVAHLQSAIAAGGGKTYAIVSAKPGPTYFLIRGNTKQPREEVAAGAIASVKGESAEFELPTTAPEAERRAKLANWITSPSNPLFARVIVNRLWHYHFGVGLVDTPNDFGFNGGRPSHPELLDYLACELADRHYSLKQMHKLIVTSATYRQSSRHNEAAAQIDAGNRLLWRKTPMRLDAEGVRDSVLAVSGKLNLAMGGPGFQDFKITIAVGHISNHFDAVDQDNEQFFRRTLYRTWARSGRNGLLDALDCPDPSATAPARQVTNSPLAALAMLNNALVLRISDAFADHLKAEAPHDVDRQIELAYRLALQRSPDADELTLAKRTIEKHGLNVLTRALFNSSEFLFVD